MSFAPWKLTWVTCFLFHTDWTDRQSRWHLPKHFLGRWNLQWVRHTDRAGIHCTLQRASNFKEQAFNSSASDYFVWVGAKIIKSYIINPSREHSEKNCILPVLMIWHEAHFQFLAVFEMWIFRENFSIFIPDSKVRFSPEYEQILFHSDILMHLSHIPVAGAWLSKSECASNSGENNLAWRTLMAPLDNMLGLYMDTGNVVTSVSVIVSWSAQKSGKQH